MHDVLLPLTAAAIGVSAWIGYRRTRDALMPLVLFGPMLLYAYAYSPAMLLSSGDLQYYIADPARVAFVATVNLMFVGLFCAGCVSASRPAARMQRQEGVIEHAALDSRTRGQLLTAAWLFGAAALAAFWYMVALGGGFVELFSRPKPFLAPPSGYVGEMPMLALPAILLLAMSLRGRKIRIRHVMLALVFALPHLVMASFGGRRGPAFVILFTLVLSWYIARVRRPSLRAVTGTAIVAGVFMLFLVSNRQNLYLGSDQDVDMQAFRDRLLVSEGSGGQEFIYSTGLILTADHHERFYWGRRYLATVFVRPIPRHVWPGKYDDLGLGWLVDQPGSAGFSDGDWREAVGFPPLSGSAGGFVADAFVELWWLGALACYLIGRLYGWCWTRSARLGGLWTVVYVELVILSVYLVSQSVGAWLYRALLLVGPTWILWKLVVLPVERRARLRAAALKPAPARS
jgi:hypothetical protein